MVHDDFRKDVVAATFEIGAESAALGAEGVNEIEPHGFVIHLGHVSVGDILRNRSFIRAVRVAELKSGGFSQIIGERAGQRGRLVKCVDVDVRSFVAAARSDLKKTGMSFGRKQPKGECRCEGGQEGDNASVHPVQSNAVVGGVKQSLGPGQS